MTYAEQLEDPRWKSLRKQILARDNYTCRDCNAVDLQLHVHHLAYISGRMAWQYGRDLLITLCLECHIERHNAQFGLLVSTSTLTSSQIQRLAASIAMGLTPWEAAA